MFQVGDIVCHTSKFLRAVGWFVNVPQNGRVEATDDDEIVTVMWCDADKPVRVNAGNLIMYAKRHTEPQ